MTALVKVAVGWAFALVLASHMAGHMACQRREPPAEQTSDPPHKPAEKQRQADHPWHYLPTLQAAVSSSARVQPVLELDDPTQGEVHILAVVGDGAGPRLELWSFDQTNKAGVLRPTSEPLVLLSFDEAGTADDTLVRAFARRLASPHTDLRRVVGIEESDPRKALHMLAAQARRLLDESLEQGSREQALFALSRALRNEPLVQPERTMAFIRRLGSASSTLGPSQRLGRRRARIRLSTPEEETDLEIELIRTGDGWAVATIGSAEKAPSTAPHAE